jgi:hypothetical protein
MLHTATLLKIVNIQLLLPIFNEYYLLPFVAEEETKRLVELSGIIPG